MSETSQIKYSHASELADKLPCYVSIKKNEKQIGTNCDELYLYKIFNSNCFLAHCYSIENVFPANHTINQNLNFEIDYATWTSNYLTYSGKKINKNLIPNEEICIPYEYEGKIINEFN
jgi:hypothetical protein